MAEMKISIVVSASGGGDNYSAINVHVLKQNFKKKICSYYKLVLVQ